MTATAFWPNKRVTVTGGAGFLGQRVCAALTERGCTSIFIPRSADYDLTDPAAVTRLYDDAQPDLVIHLAAQVGGIGANRQQPGLFCYANLAMGLHLIEEGRKRNLQKFVQVGTVCAYPKHCPTPFREDDLWNGYPEETNAPYGLAKKMLLVLLQAYRQQYDFNGIYLLPANMYGPNDNFDLQTSHVIPALIRKFAQAVETHADTVECWGTGTPTREFLYVDDAAEGILTAAQTYNAPDPINLGTGIEITIADLAKQIATLTHYTGQIKFNPHQPDGQPRRTLSTDRATQQLDWKPKTNLESGLKKTLAWWNQTGRHQLEQMTHLPSA